MPLEPAPAPPGLKVGKVGPSRMVGRLADQEGADDSPVGIDAGFAGEAVDSVDSKRWRRRRVEGRITRHRSPASIRSNAPIAAASRRAAARPCRVADNVVYLPAGKLVGGWDGIGGRRSTQAVRYRGAYMITATPTRQTA